MRHPKYRGDAATAAQLFDELPVIHVAGVGEDGGPILRTVHGVVVDGWLAFHGSPKGEKTMLVGRPVVATAEEVVASIPSYFLDPERACPATTYYRSAHAAGTLERLDDGDTKARVLQALMAKLQPEGGHRPIRADDPLYANAVRGIAVVGVRLDGAVAKLKLGQNREPAELTAVLEALWRRGEPGDPRAIDRVWAANAGRLEPPPFLRAPGGYRLRAALSERELARVTGLLEGQYWLHGVPAEVIARAHLASPAWVGVEAPDGALVGSARAVSDRARVGWVYDVVVDAAHRRRGVARAMMRLLLEHPALRAVQRVFLRTRDAAPLYAGLGFAVSSAPEGVVTMALAPSLGGR